MKKVSKLKTWLRKKGFVSNNWTGDSEYFTVDNFPVTVRIADHIGRQGTETDKYINIIPDGVDRYIFVFDRVTKTLTHKETIKAIDALIYLHRTIPLYFSNRATIRKNYDDSVRTIQSEATSQIAEQKAILSNGIKALTPIVSDLQKLVSTFNKGRQK